jgi:hypothetical protein
MHKFSSAECHIISMPNATVDLFTFTEKVPFVRCAASVKLGSVAAICCTVRGGPLRPDC